MIARCPGKIKAGTESRHVSAFWDFLPTACEAAGLAAPAAVDGISFLPELLGKTQEGHDHLYWEFFELGGRQAVRKGQWKAVRYGMSGNPDAPVELYDLDSDLGEKNNLASEYPEIVRELEGLMRSSRRPSDVFQFDYEKR
jgi:arylsulfatase A-like enzyme